jgi:exosome complex exonuclease DIS3/RRP44
MLQAQYFSSGTEAEQDFRHYGYSGKLISVYCGRLRYIKLIARLPADVIVHRLLEACIDADLTYGQELTDKMKMKELCDSKYT